MALLALFALLLAGSAAAQSSRIAYVDTKRLLDNAPQFVEGKKMLEREFAERDSTFKVQEARLAKLEEDFRRESAMLPKEIADARQFEIDTLRRNIDRTRTKMREDLSARVQQETNARWDEIHDVIVEYAREQRLEVVLQAPVIYASASIDITDALLERLKRDYERNLAAKPPAQ